MTGLFLINDYGFAVVAVVYSRCRHLSAQWEGLEQACNNRTAYLNKAMTREQVTVAKNRQSGLNFFFLHELKVGG